MKKYERTNVKYVLERPILLENNFLKIFDEFENQQISKNNININSINNNKKKNNNNFLEPNNIDLNYENFVSFGKSMNNQESPSFPISSSDSQKNKYSSNSGKSKENSLSPIPIINNDIIPIIKDMNYDNLNPKHNVPPLVKKSDFNDLKIKTPTKEIKKNKYINSEKKWKQFGESLIIKEIIENNINNDLNNINFPKNILLKLLVFNKNSDLHNNINKNNNKNDISTDMKNSIERSTKIVTTTHIKSLSNTSFDEINADNSNYYDLDKENNKDKIQIYKPTNFQNILDLNFDTILDANKFNSIINQLKQIEPEIYKFDNENIQNQENYNYQKDKELIYTIHEEPDEDLYYPESRNLSKKNNCLKNTLGISKSKEDKESFNNLNSLNNKEKNDEKKISAPFNSFNSELNKYPKEKNENNQFNNNNEDFSECFKPEPANLNELELILNNKNNEILNNINSDNNNNNNKNIFDDINKENNKSNDDNNQKNSFSKPQKDPLLPFSFGKNNFNNNSNNNKNNDSSNGKNILNSNNEEIANDEIFTFDKNKNQRNNEVKDNINENKDIIVNFEKEKLINKAENNNNVINPFDINKLNNIKENENRDNENINSNDKKSENIYYSPSSKKENEDIDNIEEIKDNKIDNNIINNSEKEKNQKHENDDKQNNIIKKEVNKNIDIKNIEKINNISKISKLTTKEEDNINKELIVNDDKENNNSMNIEKEKEINDINKDEKIILNISDSMDDKAYKNIEFNRFINSPEVLCSKRTSKNGIDNSMIIKSNLFHAIPKIISKEQLKNLGKINPKLILLLKEKKLNEDYLKFFLNDFNSIIFISDINNINKNIYKIKLQSYFNILKKVNERKIAIYDLLIENLIIETSKRIEKIKKENNINYISLISEGKNDDIFKESDNETMNLIFPILNSKLKQIKDYYSDLTIKTKRKNDIIKLKGELKDIYKDLIRLSNSIYKNSPLNKIRCYQKIIEYLKQTKIIPDNKISKKNNNEKEINSKIEKNNQSMNINMIFGTSLLAIFIFSFLMKLYK